MPGEGGVIDCHNHVLDPGRFPYAADTPYRPAGQEIAPVEQWLRVMDAHGVRHALLTGPNSGYGTDNRCLLDAVARGDGRFKGIAVVSADASTRELGRLRASGCTGVAFNPALLGVEPYLHTDELCRRLVDLDMWLQIQVEGDQLPALLPLIERTSVKLMFDHCGRPVVADGVERAAFAALCALGRTGRARIKLSGFYKFSEQPHPYADVVPFVRALVVAFGLDGCVWGSDWPFLRAPARLDYGPLLDQVEVLFPDAADRRRLLWDTPRRLFGF